MKRYSTRILLLTVLSSSFLASACYVPNILSIQVEVRDRDAPAYLIAGYQIFVHDRGGRLLETGVTDVNGLFETAPYPTNEPVTLTTYDGHRALTSVFEAVAGQSYRLFGRREQRVVGRLDLEVTAPPLGPAPQLYRISAGNIESCALETPRTGTLSIDLLEPCLQSDGSVTLYAEAIDENGMVFKRSLVADVPAPSPQQPRAIRIDNWESTLLTPVSISAIGARATLDAPALNFSVMRRLRAYQIGQSEPGALENNELRNVGYLYPASLADAAGGPGAIVGLFSRIGNSGSSRWTSVQSVLSKPPGFDFRLDLANQVPDGQVTAMIDFSRPDDVEARWSVESDTSFDALLMLFKWEVQGGPWTWEANAPVELGRAKLPRIPDIFQPPVPNDQDTRFQGEANAADVSWSDSYDEIAGRIDRRLLEGGFDKPESGQTVRALGSKLRILR